MLSKCAAPRFTSHVVSRALLAPLLAAAVLLTGSPAFSQRVRAEPDDIGRSESPAPPSAVSGDRAQLRAISQVLGSDPGLAETVVNSLGDWEALSQLPGLEAIGAPGSSQALLIHALSRASQNLSDAATAKLFLHCRDRAEDGSLELVDRCVSLRAATDCVGVLTARHGGDLAGAALADEDLARFAASLLALATDQGEDMLIRGAALEGLATLGVEEAVPDLVRVAANEGGSDPVLIQRQALLTLAVLDADGAERLAIDLLSSTESEEVIITAAAVLGQAQSETALAALVNSGNGLAHSPESIAAAVSQYKDWIDDVLSDPEHPGLGLALRALRHVQSLEEDLYRPRLIALLRSADTASRPEITAELLNGIIGSAPDPVDCVEVLKILKARFDEPERLWPEQHGYFERLSRSHVIAEQRVEAVR